LQQHSPFVWWVRGLLPPIDAEQPLPDKSGYNLFNPTPGNMMRELTPDRPDKTESPFTVDAGHFQPEMSFVEFTKNQSDGVRTKTWNVAPAVPDKYRSSRQQFS